MPATNPSASPISPAISFSIASHPAFSEIADRRHNSLNDILFWAANLREGGWHPELGRVLDALLPGLARAYAIPTASQHSEKNTPLFADPFLNVVASYIDYENWHRVLSAEMEDAPLPTLSALCHNKIADLAIDNFTLLKAVCLPELTQSTPADANNHVASEASPAERETAQWPRITAQIAPPLHLPVSVALSHNKATAIPELVIRNVRHHASGNTKNASEQHIASTSAGISLTEITSGSDLPTEKNEDTPCYVSVNMRKMINRIIRAGEVSNLSELSRLTGALPLDLKNWCSLNTIPSKVHWRALDVASNYPQFLKELTIPLNLSNGLLKIDDLCRKYLISKDDFVMQFLEMDQAEVIEWETSGLHTIMQWLIGQLDRHPQILLDWLKSERPATIFKTFETSKITPPPTPNLAKIINSILEASAIKNMYQLAKTLGISLPTMLAWHSHNTIPSMVYRRAMSVATEYPHYLKDRPAEMDFASADRLIDRLCKQFGFHRKDFFQKFLEAQSPTAETHRWRRNGVPKIMQWLLTQLKDHPEILQNWIDKKQPTTIFHDYEWQKIVPQQIDAQTHASRSKS